MLMQLIAAAVGGAKNLGTVTVSGEVIIGDNEENARLRFLTDGTVEKAVNSVPTWVQIDTANDWLRPPAPTNFYSVRFTNAVGDTGDFGGAAAEDVWIAITATRTWSLSPPGAGPGANTVDTDFEIRNDLTQVIEGSGFYEFAATTSG